jgi:hypothetical protein
VSNTRSNQVFVQVVDVRGGREIGWGANLSDELGKRLNDIRAAIEAGTRAVADSIEGLASTPGWQLNEVSASFGVTLTAEAGVLLSKASTGATFDVQVKFQHVT